MKKLINLIIVCLITFSAVAIEDDRINNEVRKEVNFNHFSKSRVILETGFGSSDFIDAEAHQELVGKDIMKVNLIYTTFREADDFDQINLNEKRWKNLFKLMPDLKNNVEVKFNEIGVDKCKVQTCAEGQMHGFVIEYKKETFNYTNLEIQSEFIQCDKVNEIKGEQGTKVKIPANAFVDALGNDVKGQVEIHLREALNVEDIILAKLFTVTDNNQMLESGGMVEITASSNGRLLRLKEGKDISISIPKKKNVSEMKAWEGTWIEGQLQWKNPQELNDAEDKSFAVDTDNVLEITENISDEVVVWENFTDSLNSIPSVSIELGEQPKVGYTQVYNLRFSTIENKLNDVHLTTKNDTLEFVKENYTFKSGQNSGLSNFQATKIMRWFEEGKIPKYVPFQFWGWNRITNMDMKELMNSNRVQVANQTRGIVDGFVDQSRSSVQTSYVNTNLTYAFTSRKMGWVNIDKIARYRSFKRTKLEILCSNDTTIDQLSVSLMIPNRNVYLAAYKLNNGLYGFSNRSSGAKYKLPAGDKAIVIMTGVIEDQWFSSIFEIKLGDNEIEETKLKPQDKNAILKQIKNFI